MKCDKCGGRCVPAKDVALVLAVMLALAFGCAWFADRRVRACETRINAACPDYECVRIEVHGTRPR